MCFRNRKGRAAQYLVYTTGLALRVKYSENASFAYNYCGNRLILKILTALESVYLVSKLVKSSRYYIIYIARGSAAKKLRYGFRF